MTTSAQLSGTGNDSARPSRNSTLPAPARLTLFLAMREHRRGHIDSDDLSVWTDHLRCDQTIDASTTADIDDPLTRLELVDAKGVACASERRDVTQRRWHNDLLPLLARSHHVQARPHPH
jgi:hypothetical protein